eukprot:jgi/Ulvmu1/10495/UM064_0033.1
MPATQSWLHGPRKSWNRSCSLQCGRRGCTSRVDTIKRAHATTETAGSWDELQDTQFKNRWQRWWSLVPFDSDAPVPILTALASVWTLTKGVRTWVALGFVCLIVAATCELAYPHLASKLLEAAQEAAVIATAGGVANGTLLHLLQDPPQQFIPIFVFMALSAVGETVFAALRAVCSSLVTVKTVKRLRASVFDSLLAQEALWFQQRGCDSASLAARITNDCEAVARIVSVNFNVALRYGVQSVGALVYLGVVNPTVAASCLITTFLMSAVSLKYGVFTRQVTRGERNQGALTSSLAEESLRSIGLVKAHGYEASEKLRFRQQLRVLAELGYLKLVGYATYLLGYIGVWHVGSMAVLFVGGCMTVHGSMTFAQLTAAYLYSEVVFDSAKIICDQIASVLENLGTIDTVLQLLTLEEGRSSESGTVQLQPGPSIWEEGMSLDGVSFMYPLRNRTVLRDVSIPFAANQSTALVGTSGSGKSTAASLLTRVLEPSSGTVRLGRLDVRNIDRDWIRRHVAQVPQTPMLFTASVFINISYGFSNPSEEAVEAAARAANAHEFICRLPHGYHTVVKDTTLSGGQRQRIAIARALFRKPKVLILDEATSALDAGTEAAVQQTLDEIIQGNSMTVVIIAHRLATVQSCSRIFVMHKGAVAESGTHDELLAAGGLYSDLVAQQSLGEVSTTDTESDDDASGAPSAAEYEDSVPAVKAAS